VLVRRSPSGQLTSVAVPNPFNTGAPLGVSRLEAGPDGNIWVVYVGDPDAVLRVGPDGRISVIRLPDGWITSGLARGADGAMWVPAEAQSGTGPTRTAFFKIDSSDGTVHEFQAPSDRHVTAPTLGGDGNMWYFDFAPWAVSYVTPDGQYGPLFPDVATPYGLTLGPDGNLWAPPPTPTPPTSSLVRITTAGIKTEFRLPLTEGYTISTPMTLGLDRALWAIPSVSGPEVLPVILRIDVP